jgi:hypothetical protein
MCVRDLSTLARALGTGAFALWALTAAAADASLTQGSRIATHGTPAGVPACITCCAERAQRGGRLFDRRPGHANAYPGLDVPHRRRLTLCPRYKASRQESSVPSKPTVTVGRSWPRL